MIIDGVNVLDLAIGTDRRIPEEGDTSLRIPSSILPVLLNAKRHTVPALSTDVMDVSFITENSQSLNNQGTTSSVCVSLARGLWELELILVSQFDFASAVAGFKMSDIILTFKGADRRLLSRMAAIGSFTDYNRLRLLLDQTTTIKIRGSATALGEHLDQMAIINGIRIL